MRDHGLALYLRATGPFANPSDPEVESCFAAMFPDAPLPPPSSFALPTGVTAHTISADVIDDVVPNLAGQ